MFSQPLAVKFQSRVCSPGGKKLLFIETHKNMRYVSYLIPSCCTLFLLIIYFPTCFAISSWLSSGSSWFFRCVHLV